MEGEKKNKVKMRPMRIKVKRPSNQESQDFGNNEDEESAKIILGML